VRLTLDLVSRFERRLNLAYVDGRPAAQASLHWRDHMAYLESAGTLPA
jgi:hypothetical protein